MKTPKNDAPLVQTPGQWNGFSFGATRCVSYGADASQNVAAIVLDTDCGNKLTLHMRPDTINDMIKALENARDLAGGKPDEAPKAIFAQTCEVGKATTFDGAFIAFDKGLPSMAVYGVPRTAAKEMGRALINSAQHAGPKILMPPRDIIASR